MANDIKPILDDLRAAHGAATSSTDTGSTAWVVAHVCRLYEILLRVVAWLAVEPPAATIETTKGPANLRRPGAVTLPDVLDSIQHEHTRTGSMASPTPLSLFKRLVEATRLALDDTMSKLEARALSAEKALRDVRERPFEFLHGLGYRAPGGASVTILAGTGTAIDAPSLATVIEELRTAVYPNYSTQDLRGLVLRLAHAVDATIRRVCDGMVPRSPSSVEASASAPQEDSKDSNHEAYRELLRAIAAEISRAGEPGTSVERFGVVPAARAAINALLDARKSERVLRDELERHVRSAPELTLTERARTAQYNSVGKNLIVVDTAPIPPENWPSERSPEDVVTGKVVDAGARALWIAPHARPGRLVMFRRRDAAILDVEDGSPPRRDVLSVSADNIVAVLTHHEDFNTETTTERSS